MRDSKKQRLALWRERCERVRNILLHEWDPIAVGAHLTPADEYDGWIPRLVRLLEEGADEVSLQRCLMDIEDELGVGVSERKRAHTVKALLKAAESFVTSVTAGDTDDRFS